MNSPARAPGTLNLRVGSELSGLPDQRIEQIFRVSGSGAPAAVAVADATTVRILLQDSASDLAVDPRSELRFFSEIVAYVARHIVGHRIDVVGPGATGIAARRVMVELAREFPNLRRHLVLCVEPGVQSDRALSPAARQLLSQISQVPLAPDGRSGTGVAPAEAPAQRNEPISELGLELRDALEAVPHTAEPISAFGEITRLVTPLPETQSSFVRLVRTMRERLADALTSRTAAPGR
ncbi:hypothetical protein [Devosia sp.]|uniref:hypothetical protein n=1 Tax=Devosia sp. TaxID=1871048 RepID=UPI003A92C57F